MLRVVTCYGRLLVRSCGGLILLLALSLLVTYGKKGSLDWFLEGELFLFGVWVAIVVHHAFSREVMEYLYSLPFSRSCLAFSPYIAGAALLVLAAMLVYAAETTGAAYVVFRSLIRLLGGDPARLSYQPRPFEPWLNVWAAPLFSFWVSVLLTHKWRHKVGSTKAGSASSWSWVLLSIFLVPLLIFVLIQIGGSSPSDNPPFRRNIVHHNVPGMVGLVIAAAASISLRRHLKQMGLESFPVREESWEY